MKYLKVCLIIQTEALCDNMWANMNKRYSHNRNHVHPGALWSGVYIIRCPKDSGRIWFTDPQRRITMILVMVKIEIEIMARSLLWFKRNGRLILFPGWLTHEVEINLNKEFEEDDRRGWRYSLSFNFIQRFKPNFNH